MSIVKKFSNFSNKNNLNVIMFFPSSIDNKSIVTDPNGNEIVNLPISPFYKNAEMDNYTMKMVPPEYTMRPDKIALVELGTVEKTEYIMMFNQIGNPFSINEDDVLLIPDGVSADSIVIPYSDGMASTNPDDPSIQSMLVANYYKYAGHNNNVDMNSYNDFLNDEIPSGNTDEDNNEMDNSMPYMLDDNEEAMIIKNGKIYFNNPNDAGINADTITTDDIDSTITDLLNGVSTDLSASNCVYNGTNLSDFIKALNNNS